MINILLINQHSYPPGRSNWRRHFDLFKSFSKEDYNIDIICGSFIHDRKEEILNKGEKYRLINSEGIKYHVLSGISYKSKIVRMLSMIQFFFKVLFFSKKIKEKPDIIVAIVHSGEEPKNPKNPGNRIKELATTVEGIDAIVAGHTHEKIEQHTYKNNSGEEVIVTQPGAHGNSISKINFKLDKKNDKWFIKDKYSELKVFGKEVNIITTSGLNPKFSDEMAVNLFNERDRDVQPIFIDTGDFLNTNTKEMTKWAKEWQYNENKGIYKKINEWPIVYLGYDAVVLGSHDFTEDKETFEEKKSTLDYIIENFEEMKIPVLSANIYDESGENYVKPYIIHNVETREGNIKVGVLGLTTTDKDEEDLSNSSLSKDSKTSKIPEETGKLYTNNLVKDASEWVKVMQKESPDVIVAVVHSDNNSTLKNPSSEVKKLAMSVDGIDAIVVGHTKNKVEEHIYKNKSGDEVIVTQSGEDCYSKISLELRKENGKWNIINKYSKAIKMK